MLWEYIDPLEEELLKLKSLPGDLQRIGNTASEAAIISAIIKDMLSRDAPEESRPAKPEKSRHPKMGPFGKLVSEEMGKKTPPKPKPQEVTYDQPTITDYGLKGWNGEPLMGGFGIPQTEQIGDFVGRRTSDQFRPIGQPIRKDRDVREEFLRAPYADDRSWDATEITDFPGDLGMVLTPEENMLRALLGNRWTPEGRQAGSEVLQRHLGDIVQQATAMEQLQAQREMGLAEMAQQEALAKMQLQQAEQAATMDFIAKMKEAEATQSHYDWMKSREARRDQQARGRGESDRLEEDITFGAQLAQKDDSDPVLRQFFTMHGILSPEAQRKWRDLSIQRELAYRAGDEDRRADIEQQLYALSQGDWFSSLR